MGPRIKNDTLKHRVEDAILQAALPYNKAEYQKVEANEKNEEISTNKSEIPSTSDESEYSDAMRVSTRARFSYELDRYKKNAMLIFEGNSTIPPFVNHTEDVPATPSDDVATKFKQTFEKFRFEVEVHRNLTDEEISRTAESFFQRDFTEYGCVAIMMLMKTKDGQVESCHTHLSEIGVARYMSDQKPITLQNKPTVYIVQAQGTDVSSTDQIWPSWPADNLEIRLPAPIISFIDGKPLKVCCPLEHVHRSIDKLGDRTDLHTILHDSLMEFIEYWKIGYLISGFYSSLTKEVRFAKS